MISCKFLITFKIRKKIHCTRAKTACLVTKHEKKTTKKKWRKFVAIQGVQQDTAGEFFVLQLIVTQFWERADKALEQWLVSNFVVCNKWTWHTRVRQASAVIYVLQEIFSLCNSMLSDESESESCGICSCIIYSYDPPASKARSKKNPRSLHFIDLLDESSRHHHRPHVFFLFHFFIAQLISSRFYCLLFHSQRRRNASNEIKGIAT